MKNFFTQMFKILNNKYFRVLLTILVVILLFYKHLVTSKFNKNKFDDVITAIKNDKKIDDLVKKYEYADKTEVVKKQIIKSDEEEEKIEVDPKIKKITNILLKLQELEKNYKYNLKNNKINYKRVIKYGDTIYYSLRSIFNNNQNDKNSPESHFFIKLIKGDIFSDKLVGKRVGQKVIFNYDDMLNNMTEKDKKVVNNTINSTMDELNKKYGKGEKIFKNYNITYELTALDFISDDVIKELELINNK